MNLLLIEPEELDGERVRVSGRRAAHLQRVLGKAVGDSVRVGVVGDRLGEGIVEAIEGGEVWLRVAVSDSPPAPSPVQLVLALPRPPMLRRILQHATALGVKRIVLLGTARVEKSFWTSHAVREAEIAAQLRLGLEQAKDTVLPTVALRRRFRPFVEDELAAVTGRRLLAEPSEDAVAVPAESSSEPTTVVVGPEGGLVPFEVELLRAQGFSPVSLGRRILRVETAVVALLARLWTG